MYSYYHIKINYTIGYHSYAIYNTLANVHLGHSYHLEMEVVVIVLLVHHRHQWYRIEVVHSNHLHLKFNKDNNNIIIIVVCIASSVIN